MMRQKTLDSNEFKVKVKAWMQQNPEAKVEELRDYCEDLLPPELFQSHQWIVDQTLDWYRFILSKRRLEDLFSCEDEH